MADTEWIGAIGRIPELAGIAVMVVGALIATGGFLRRWRRDGTIDVADRFYRQGLGRGGIAPIGPNGERCAIRSA